MNWRLAGAATVALALAACGNTAQERTTGGAAAGAATGAGIGALGGPVGALAGAGIGAGAGAVTGAVTEPSTLNLGQPPWSNPQAEVPFADRGRRGARGATANVGLSTNEIRQLQNALNDRGYQAGPVDGIWGPRTRRALVNYQQASNVPVTGRPNDQTMNALIGSSGSSSRTTGADTRNGPPSPNGGGSINNTNSSGVGSGNQPGSGETSGRR
jgi:peptidoglycan hydrolase-like protein with peptidoglycan-binding domain